MQLRNSTEGYGAIAKALHWTVAALVILAWILGTVGDELPRGAARATGRFIHMSAGLAILALLVIRLMWRLSDPPPPPEITPFGRWADRAGRFAHWLLYVLLAAVIGAGIIGQFADGDALPVFGLLKSRLPPNMTNSRRLSKNSRSFGECACYRRRASHRGGSCPPLAVSRPYACPNVAGHLPLMHGKNRRG